MNPAVLVHVSRKASNDYLDNAQVGECYNYLINICLDATQVFHVLDDVRRVAGAFLGEVSPLTAPFDIPDALRVDGYPDHVMFII